MQRVVRRLFTAAAFLSLVLCIAIVSLWIRSRKTDDRITHYGPEYIRAFASDSGRIVVSRTDNRWVKAAVYIPKLMAADPTFAEAARQEPQALRTLQLAEPHWERNAFPAFDPTKSMILSSSLLGFGYARAISGDTIEGGIWIVVPYWALTILASILPAIWTLHLVRQVRRKRLGHCTVCGYDLRASKDRCPECGTEIRFKE